MSFAKIWKCHLMICDISILNFVSERIGKLDYKQQLQDAKMVSFVNLSQIG